MNQNSPKFKSNLRRKKTRKKKRRRKKNNKFSNRKNNSKFKNKNLKKKKKIRKISKFRTKMMKMKNICILTTLRRSQLMQSIRKTKTNLINSQTMKKSSNINPIDKIVLKLVQTIVNICSSFLNITAE